MSAIGDYQLRVIYLIPANRTPQENAETILQDYVLRSQAWFQEQMERLGYGPKTFEYETDDSNGVLPKINIVNVSDLDTCFHDSGYLDRWQKILGTKEIPSDGEPQSGCSVVEREVNIGGQIATKRYSPGGLAGAGFAGFQPGEVLLVIAEIHQQLADGSLLPASLFSGGAGTDSSGVSIVSAEELARFSADLLTDERSYDGLTIPGIGPYPAVANVTFPWFEGKTLSSISSSAQGVGLHELAHGFALKHDFRNDKYEFSDSGELFYYGNLMGFALRGLRGSLFPKLYPKDDTHLSSGSALALNYSRFFNIEQVFSEDEAPQVDLPLLNNVDPDSVEPIIVEPVDGLLQIEFSASDNTALAGALLLKPDGNGVQQVVADMPLNGQAVTTAINTYDYEPGVTEQWTLVVFDTQGNRTQLDPISLTPAEGFNQAPVPFIEISKTRVEAGDKITLDARSTFDPDGTLSDLKIRWNLGNNSAVFGKASVASYSEPGVYQIIARLTDATGAVSRSIPFGIRVTPATISGLNDSVMLAPDLATANFTSDATGCPAGFAGKYSFDSNLTNESTVDLLKLSLTVVALTNDNLLLVGDDFIGQGEQFVVSVAGEYSDGVLSPGETIIVPMTLCLNSLGKFDFLIDVVGKVSLN